MADNKIWRCAECMSIFPKSKLLETHSRQTKHKAYRCTKETICHKSFNLRTALIRHESTHALHKKHACGHCNKSFHRRDHCQEHEAVCSTPQLGESSPAGNSNISPPALESESAAPLTTVRSEDAPSPSMRAARGSGHIQDGVATQDSEDHLALQRPRVVSEIGLQRNEPNPFEKAFGGLVDTPGKPRLPLPGVTSLASRASRSPSITSGWPASLRSGPLSPAMLIGPTSQSVYDNSDYHFQGRLQLPNQSSLRTTLNSGGGGSMFPRPSPKAQALYNQLQSGGATPGTADFYRIAMIARVQAQAGNYSLQELESPIQLSHGSAMPQVQAIQPSNTQQDSNVDLGEPSPPQSIKSTQKPPVSHKCPYCSSQFTRHSTLKEHLLTHTNERPYRCQSCDSRFRRLQELRRHVRLHSGEKNFVCDKCGRRFARSDGLVRHSRSVSACTKPVDEHAEEGTDEEAEEEEREKKTERLQTLRQKLEKLCQALDKSNQRQHAANAAAVVSILGAFARLDAPYPAATSIDGSASRENLIDDIESRISALAPKFSAIDSGDYVCDSEGR